MIESMLPTSGRGVPVLAIVLVGLLALSLVLAGCAQSASSPSNGSAMAQGANASVPVSDGKPGSMPIKPSADGVAPPSSGSGAMPSKSGSGAAVSNGSAMADNKTGYDKTQMAIASILPDGAYEKNVTYAYHSGEETADIQISVKDDVVTAASVKLVGSPNSVSQRIANNFNDALPGLVVGKKINELNLPHNVAGSSLTTAAFAGYVDELVQSRGAA
ncbi:Uncharacterised protein [uncultured archaeon]|nr:Uncharacterised protein [uncultured archaeon]